MINNRRQCICETRIICFDKYSEYKKELLDIKNGGGYFKIQRVFEDRVQEISQNSGSR